MKFKDIEIICKDCHCPFLWTVEQQEKYEKISQIRESDGENPLSQPKRCYPCRIAKKKKYGDII